VKWALRVYRNIAGQERNHLRLRLVGSGTGGANRSAIGARVRITAGGRTQTHLVQGGYGHTIVEGDLIVTAGLGSARVADEVEVRWPDAAGTVTTYRDLRANYTIELREGEPTRSTSPKLRLSLRGLVAARGRA
jgi:hypothetical protein